MKTVTRPLKCGALLFLATATLTSCRKDPPPPIPICIGDGFGGGDCTDTTGELAEIGCTSVSGGDGHRFYCPPSKMKNFWATTETGMKNYSAWAYGATPQESGPIVDAMKAQALGTTPEEPTP